MRPDRTPGLQAMNYDEADIDLLDRVPYLKYFPPAVEFNRRRIPSQRDVIDTMRASGFFLLRHDVVEQPYADTFGDYYDKISQRGLSDLAALPDADFEAGIRKMKQALTSGKESAPVIEPIDLFVFVKKVEPGAAADADRPCL